MEIKILVVDDEQAIIRTAKAYFEQESYIVQTASDGNEALKIAETFEPDVVILDIMLPGIDGLEVLRRLRTGLDPFVILLSARTDENDRVIGLKMGADDYVVKPFSPRELVARVEAFARRLQSRTEPADNSLRLGDITVDRGARRAWIGKKELELTRIEFDLLFTLMRYAGRVLSREQLIEHVWGGEYFIEERVVDVHIRRLRKKLEEAAGDRGNISTIRGIGYRFEAQE